LNDNVIALVIMQHADKLLTMKRRRQVCESATRLQTDSMKSAKPAAKSQNPEKLDTRVWRWITLCLSSPLLQDQPKPIQRSPSVTKRKRKQSIGASTRPRADES
jgi:hypothetical protein